MTAYILGATRPTLPENGAFWIAPSATVIGNVVLGADSSVWFGAVIRGDNERIVVGPRTNIQDNSVLHTDAGVPLVIGADVTVGHMATIHGAEIGEGSLIGIGAILLNGCRIGRGCIVGAGALVTEGKVIPDHSLAVGSPARVIRAVTADERAGLMESARHYVAQWKRYESALKPAD